jgi:hypothetical protein
VDLDDATATYRITDLPVRDFPTLVDALSGASFQPAIASFQLQWHLLDVTDRTRTKVRDATQDFAGKFWSSTSSGAATLEWSATLDGFTFTSDAAATSHSYVAVLGHERNGVFFRGREDEDEDDDEDEDEHEDDDEDEDEEGHDRS